MQIALAAVEPDDLVSVQVDDDFSIEFRVEPHGQSSFIRGGTRFLVAYATPAEFAAVTSPTGEVDLLQRLAPVGTPGREQARHPHGWAMSRPGAELHYFENTAALCGAVAGYAGLCYPTYREGFFQAVTVRCDACRLLAGQN